jgi:hypothetical protein
VVENFKARATKPAVRWRTSTPSSKFERPTCKKLITKPGMKKHVKSIHTDVTAAQSNELEPSAGDMTCSITRWILIIL